MASEINPGNVDRHWELTGLLLGAGASYDLGMPLVWELTHELKRWLTPEKLRSLNRHWRCAGLGYPDVVIETLEAVLERPDMHYENILGHLQVQSQRHSDTLQSYNGLYMFLAEIIYALLQERHLLNIPYIERNIRYLDGIKTLARENLPLWIFSLNHDLIIESFAADAGIPLNSGFTEETIRLPRRDSHGALIGELKANILPEDVLKKRGLPFLHPGEPGINLLKIHGSLDVFTFRDGRDVLKLVPHGEGIKGVISSLRLANQELRYVGPGWPDEVVTSLNEIIYADEMGEMQFLRRSLLAGAYKFEPRHSQVIPNELLTYFETHLNYLRTLVCIGYGFGDQHINQKIRGWLEFSSDRHFTIVSPEANQIPHEFLHLAPQVELVTSDCTDYLDQVGSIDRGSLDRVARRFGTWKRVKGLEAEGMFNDFLQKETNHYVERAVEWAKSLPMREGDIDLEKLGMTAEELAEVGRAEVAIPSAEELLEKFLHQDGAGHESA